MPIRKRVFAFTRMEAKVWSWLEVGADLATLAALGFKVYRNRGGGLSFPVLRSILEKRRLQLFIAQEKESQKPMTALSAKNRIKGKMDRL